MPVFTNDLYKLIVVICLSLVILYVFSSFNQMLITFIGAYTYE